MPTGAELIAALPPAQRARRSVPASLPGETGAVRKAGTALDYIALKRVTLLGVAMEPGDIVLSVDAHQIRNIHALVGQRLLAPIAHQV